MISSYVGENAEFERQFLSGELEVKIHLRYFDAVSSEIYYKNSCQMSMVKNLKYSCLSKKYFLKS